LKAVQHTENTLKEKLQLEKERSYTLEHTLNDLVHKRMFCLIPILLHALEINL